MNLKVSLSRIATSARSTLSVAGLAVAGLSLALSSFGAHAQDTLGALEEAAKKEGKLVMYTTANDQQMALYLGGFKEAYPEIEVTYMRYSSSILLTRFMGEFEAGVITPDVLFSSTSKLFQQRPDIFEPLTADNLPAVAAGKFLVDPRTDSYRIVYINPHVFIYNVDMVSQQDLAEHMKSWEDLADPFWKDKFVMVDPLSITATMSFYHVLGERFGDAWLQAITANKVSFVESGGASGQQVGAGEFAATFPTTYNNASEPKAAGAPVDFIIPGGPVHGVEHSEAIPKGAAHPNAAKLFVNWMLTEPAQKLVCSNGRGIVPILEGITGECEPLGAEYLRPIENITPEQEKHVVENLKRE